jgi:hypothetical protein
MFLALYTESYVPVFSLITPITEGGDGGEGSPGNCYVNSYTVD